MIFNQYIRIIQKQHVKNREKFWRLNTIRRSNFRKKYCVLELFMNYISSIYISEAAAHALIQSLASACSFSLISSDNSFLPEVSLNSCTDVHVHWNCLWVERFCQRASSSLKLIKSFIDNHACGQRYLSRPATYIFKTKLKLTDGWSWCLLWQLISIW